MPLPLWFVTMSQPPEVNPEGLTRPSPLLQTPLALCLGSAPTPTATCCVMVMPQYMLTVPHFVGALSAGLFRRALGALARLKPWGRCSSKLGEEPILLVDPDEVLLPASNDHRTVLVQNDGSRIF